MTDISEVDEFLVHYGTKGMHWGVRKQNNLRDARRVAAGKAGKLDKTLYVLTQLKTDHLIRAKGSVRKAAKLEVKELMAQKSRIEAGKAHIGDKLEYYLTTPMYEIAMYR